MPYRAETPFDNIESSQEFVTLLAEAVETALIEVQADIESAGNEGALRRKQALQLVAFNLTKLSSHLSSSRRFLNDLRSLRRLLLEERSLTSVYKHTSDQAFL